METPQNNIQGILPFTSFDVNEGTKESPLGGGTYRLPSQGHQILMSVDDYASSFNRIIKAGGIMALAKDMGMGLPPQTQSFGKISYMPNNSTTQMGILQWPGLPPESLQKLAREMIAINMIVQQRCTDIARFAGVSDYPWRPGWVIKPINKHEKINAETRKEILAATQFLNNCGNFSDPLERDNALRPSFSQFLLKIVRDSLVYDGIAIWKSTNAKGEITSFSPLPAGKVRLLARPDKAQMQDIHEGALNFYGATSMAGKQPAVDLRDPPFAVIIDETNSVVQSFTRNELIWYVRNPRSDAEIAGYGNSEIEQGLVLVTGLNNAIQFNADLFNKNAIPKGILTIKGNFTQRQFDALGRMWENMQRGSQNEWSLPAIQMSEKGAIDIINLEPLRKEPVYYNNLINLFMGAFATLYCIPPHRLGYKISGTERDSRPDGSKSLQDEEDKGLPVLLDNLEFLINDYILSNKWPQLKFEFTGKTPKEDARLYEVSLLTKTVDERRQMVGDPPYIELLSKDATEMEEMIARLMGMAPVDPVPQAVYQSVLAALAKAGAFNIILGLGTGEEGGEGGPGASGLGDLPGPRIDNKKDPAKLKDHGHQSGVRRDSKKERSSKSPPNLRRLTDSYSKPDTQGYSGTTPKG